MSVSRGTGERWCLADQGDDGQAGRRPESVPVSPNKKLDIALGLLVGLALGIGIAVLRDTLDTTVKTTSDLALVTKSAFLGGIVFDAEVPKRPLITHADPQSRRAESFRHLRTNLQFLDITNDSKSFVITSSVGGEGKSTTCANLAVALAATGSRVALVEGDLRRPKVADYLGLERAVGLTTVLIGQATIIDVMQSWGNGQLHVLPAGRVPPNPSELLGSPAMKSVIRQLEASYDYVLIDAPPLLPVTDATVLSRFAGGAIVVVGSGKIRRDQLRRSLETLAAVDVPVHGLILNFLPTKGPDADSYYAYGYDGIKQKDAAPVRQLATRRQLRRRSDDAGRQRPAQSQGRPPLSSAHLDVRPRHLGWGCVTRDSPPSLGVKMLRVPRSAERDPGASRG